MSVAVDLQHLTKDFCPGLFGRSRRALDDVTLQVPSGTVCGLIGPNGSGKSTTIKLLVGLLTATRGSARIWGAPAGSPGALRHLGYLPESPVWPEYLTGREWIELAARLAGLDRAALRTRVESVIAAVALEADADRRIAVYSKGLRQRLGLAQAIVHEPRLLILDEPADGLDPDAALLCQDLIVRHRAAGGTVLIASHQFDLLESVCDHVAILDHGRLVRAGALELLGRTEPETESPVAITGLPPSEIAALRGWAADRGAQVQTSGPAGARLARVYQSALTAGAGRAVA